MFESLGDRLQSAVDKIKGYGKITEDNIKDITREIRLALLEADVNYEVVKEFVANVKEKALGEEVAKSLKPGEVFVKILKDELVELFTNHFPVSMYINIWCKDKLLRASIDHKGSPQRRFCREDIVDGVRNSNTPWIKTEKPLELAVKELGL